MCCLHPCNPRELCYAWLDPTSRVPGRFAGLQGADWVLNGWVLGGGGVGNHPGTAVMLSRDAVLGSQVHWVIAAPPEGTPDVPRCDGHGFLSAFYLLVKQETVLVRKCN